MTQISQCLSKEVRRVLTLSNEDLARLMLVCVRTVYNWERKARPSKLHEQVMLGLVDAGRSDGSFRERVHTELARGSPLKIIAEVLARRVDV